MGQTTTIKEEAALERKAKRWAAVNPNKPDDNPFLKAIKPDSDRYGEPNEKKEELKERLANQEFGNFIGYYNYRNKSTKPDELKKDEISSKVESNDIDGSHNDNRIESSIEIDKSSLSETDSNLSDERLRLMKKEWFDGKNVLDIGCNRGHITYAISRLYSPKLIVGIDIDLKLINLANRDIYLHLETGILKDARKSQLERAAKLSAKDPDTGYVEDQNHFPLSSYIAHGPIALTSEESSEFNGFPNNIIFVEHNYVLSTDDLVEKQKPQFDTILCLSVTKWIHLNYRDDGLKRFFKRIYKHLNTDGILILEAQPFDRYNRRKLGDRLRSNFYSIKFKPEEFDAYLLSNQVGFRELIYESVTDHTCVGFKRPFKVFLK